jgi:hypothetical protein
MRTANLDDKNGAQPETREMTSETASRADLQGVPTRPISVP